MPSTSPPSPTALPANNTSLSSLDSEQMPKFEKMEIPSAVTSSENTNTAESESPILPAIDGPPSFTTTPQPQEDMLAYLNPHYHPFLGNSGQHAGLDTSTVPKTAKMSDHTYITHTPGSTNEEDSPVITLMSPEEDHAPIAQHTHTSELPTTSVSNPAEATLLHSEGFGAAVEDEEYPNGYESSEFSDEEAIGWEDTNHESIEDYDDDYDDYDEDGEDDEDDEGSVEAYPPYIIASINAIIAQVMADLTPYHPATLLAATASTLGTETASTNDSLSAQEVSNTVAATDSEASQAPLWDSATLSNFAAAFPSADQFEAAVTSALDAGSISNGPLLDFLNVIPLPPVASSLNGHRHHHRTSFDAAAYVKTLEEVDISTISAQDMKCPFCWLPFGTTDEDDPSFVYTPDPDEVPKLSTRQTVLRELPFCEARPDNDPVKTPCGHIFGRGCLIESLDKVDTLCPTCRRDLRPAVAGPTPEIFGGYQQQVVLS